MRKTVVLLGIVTALAFVSPALRPAPAMAADASTTTVVDGVPWRLLLEVVKKISLEAYLLVDRLMDGARSGNNGCSCGGTGGCACCRAGTGATGGTGSGGTTGIGGTGGSTTPGAPPDSTP